MSKHVRQTVWASAYGTAFADMVASVMPMAYADIAERAVNVANIAMSNYDLLETTRASKTGEYDPSSIPDWEEE